MEKVTLSYTASVEPDIPRNREFVAMIQETITEIGWEEFEREFVAGMGLYLVGEGDGMRHYERPDGQVKISIGIVKKRN